MSSISDEPITSISEPIESTSEPITSTSEPIKPTSEPIKPTSELIKPTSEPIKPTSEPITIMFSPSQPKKTKACLLTLPTEVRVMILRLCLVQPATISLAITMEKVKRHEPLEYEIPPQEFDITPQVLLACKQMYNEGMSLLYSENIFSLPVRCSDREALPYILLHPQKKNLLRISKLEVHGPGACEYYESFELLDPHNACRHVELSEALRYWPRMDGIRWISCVVEDCLKIVQVGQYLGTMSTEESLWARSKHCSGLHDDRLDEVEQPVELNEEERRCLDQILKLAALQIARTVREDGQGFTNFYSAVRLFQFGRIKRLILVTKGPVESMPGLRLDNVQQIRPIAELEIDSDRCQVRETSGPRVGFRY